MEAKDPKQKAIELVAKFQKDAIIEHPPFAGALTEYSKLNDREAKQCALIAVEELINYHYRLFESQIPLVGIIKKVDIVNIEYNFLIDVKTELEKL